MYIVCSERQLQGRLKSPKYGYADHLMTPKFCGKNSFFFFEGCSAKSGWAVAHPVYPLPPPLPVAKMWQVAGDLKLTSLQGPPYFLGQKFLAV
jgi:hypothetical protein